MTALIPWLAGTWKNAFQIPFTRAVGVNILNLGRGFFGLVGHLDRKYIS